MSLDTNTDVEELRKVQDSQGVKQAPANETQQQTTNDRLGNFDSLTQFVHSTGGTAGEALPSKAVPHGVEVLVEYKEGNAGSVYLGDSDTQEALISSAGSGRTFRVADTSAVYVRTPTAGDSVVVTFES